MPGPREHGAAGRVAGQVAEVEPMVRAICRRRFGDHDGDDVAQHVLVRLWRALESGREFDSVHKYAATAARCEALPDRKQRVPVPVGDIAEWWGDETAPGPAEQVERSEEVAQAKARVEGLLEQLKPREAEAIRATALAERSPAEAAEELGIKPTSVRSSQVRAMARLRDLCGTRTSNPLANDVPFTDRGRYHWQQDKARAAAREAAEQTTGQTAGHTAEAAPAELVVATARERESAELDARAARAVEAAAEAARAAAQHAQTRTQAHTQHGYGDAYGDEADVVRTSYAAPITGTAEDWAGAEQADADGYGDDRAA
ncbi:hypothetical protein BJF78_34105 [Pseudonocardia sp. CNS-139]|nr:hypothetical protein BJF78_34105 [Pseudonocardia sp. CNS-139]